MKTSIIQTTALLGFFSLVAAAATSTSADLAPDDVPLLCVDICGPMVELSSICQIPVGSSSDELRKLKRREFIEAQMAESAITARAELSTAAATAAASASPTLTHSFKFVNDTQNSGNESSRKHVSGFRTQTGAASASAFPQSTSHHENSTQTASSTARFGNSTATHSGTSTTPFLNSTHTTTSISSFRNSISATLTSVAFTNTTTISSTLAKTTSSSSSSNANDLPTIVESTNPLAVGNAAGTQNVDPGTSSVPSSTGSGTATASTSAVREGQLSGGDMKRVQAAEKDCVCSNESFNVAKVAALCASCISQAGFPMGPAEYIVWNCNFTKQQWTRSQDKVANNVVVKAKTPQVTGVNSAGRMASHSALAAMLSGVFALVIVL